MHKTMVSVTSLEKIEIIRSEEFMPSKARQKFLKKMIILGPKTAILGPQFCRILVLGLIFGGQGEGPGPRRPPGSAPGSSLDNLFTTNRNQLGIFLQICVFIRHLIHDKFYTGAGIVKLRYS